MGSPWWFKEQVKERKDNVSTKSQNLQKSSGLADLGNIGQVNLGMLKQTLGVGEKMIGTQQIRLREHTAAAEKFQHVSFGELRLSFFGFAKHIESFQPDRLDCSQRIITFGIDTAACKTVIPDNHPATCGYLIHKRFSARVCVQHCRPRQSV